jgi:hypothetical protein
MLIIVSAVVGHALLGRGLPIVLPSPPLLAFWQPHVGWGTPLVGGCLLIGLRLLRVVTRLGWRRLLLVGWMLNLAWMCSLTLVDGLRMGWTSVLMDPNEYLHDLPRIGDPAVFVSSFSRYIAFGPGVGGDEVWTTHVAGHPPLATLVFWLLARIGLDGGFWAGGLCIMVGSSAGTALVVTLNELGATDAARRLVPLVALFPGAVWMAVSADGLFAGVAMSGLALATAGAVRERAGLSLLGGLLLGSAVFLSYGLVLFGVVVLTVVIITVRSQGRRITAPRWLAAAAGVVLVAAVHLAFGFNWWSGLVELHRRYYQGIASQRPFSYFAYAGLAAWLISCSPLLAVGIARAGRALLPVARRWCGRGDHVVALVALSGVLAALLADISTLSKGETERIWLTFGIVAFSGLALVRGRLAAWYLAAGATWAMLINHLFDTGW